MKYLACLLLAGVAVGQEIYEYRINETAADWRQIEELGQLPYGETIVRRLTIPPPDPTPEPDPPPTELTTEWLEATTLTGGRIARISHPTSRVIAHINSGGWQAFSADSKWLSVFVMDPGQWYAVHVETLELVPLMPRSMRSGNVNINVIWAPDGHDYFRINAQNLERWTVGADSPSVSVPLPDATITHPVSRDATRPQYRASIGSGRTNPALLIYENTSGEHGVLGFNPVTLEFRPVWWVRDVLIEANKRGTTTPAVAVAVRENAPNLGRSHNTVTALGGYMIQPQADQGRPHYVDGKTALVIEPPPDDVGNRESHHAFRGARATHGDNGRGSGVGVLRDWTLPPTMAYAYRDRLIDKTPLMAHFSHNNENAIAYHYADIGHDTIVTAWIDWKSPLAERDTVLATVRWRDGRVTPQIEGIKQNHGAGNDFYAVIRPSIAPDGRHAQYHDQTGPDPLAVYLFEVKP